MKIRKKRESAIPLPSASRLCRVYSLLIDAEKKGIVSLSSADIGSMLGVSSHNIRKDISYLGEAGTSGAGYQISRLRLLIEDQLGFGIHRNACVVGLGALGSAIMSNEDMLGGMLSIKAGFDSSINRIETMVSPVPVYPAYEIGTIVKEKNIEIALVTEAGSTLDVNIQRLEEGGIKGIVNMTSMLIRPSQKQVVVRNLDLIGEFRLLTVLLNQHDHSH